MYSHIPFDFAQSILSEYDEDGVLGVQLDHYGGEGHATSEVHSPFGFQARPLDPDKDASGEPGAGCAVLWWREGGQTHAMPLNDHRVRELLPKLRKGGSMMYSGSGSYAVFDGEDPAKVARPGSFIVGIPYTSGGKDRAHTLTLDKRTDGSESVSLRHGSGMGVQMVAGGKNSIVIRNAAGDAYVEINDDGVIINGELKVNGAITSGDPGTSEALVKLEALALWAQGIERSMATGNASGPIVVTTPWASVEKQVGSKLVKGG